MKTLVVVPVFNEFSTLGAILSRIRHYHNGDIVAVDDGSDDGSTQLIERTEDVGLIRHEKNLGYGRSLIDGFEYAVNRGYDFVVTIDCDEQHEPRCIPRMFGNIADNDVLSGSRYLKESDLQDAAPRDRRRINLIITEIINRVTGYNLTDSFCGFKCYRVSALEKLQLDEPGYAQPMQFWVQARHFGLKVAETPVPRIYKNLDRKFGGELDDPQSRLNYYKRVLEKELTKWSMSLRSERILTI